MKHKPRIHIYTYILGTDGRLNADKRHRTHRIRRRCSPEKLERLAAKLGQRRADRDADVGETAIAETATYWGVQGQVLDTQAFAKHLTCLQILPSN